MTSLIFTGITILCVFLNPCKDIMLALMSIVPLNTKLKPKGIIDPLGMWISFTG